MIVDWERQEIVDTEQMKMLSVFHWVLGGFNVLCSLYGWFYVLYGAFFMSIPFETTGATAPSEQFPAFLGWFMVAIGGGIILAFGIVAALEIFSGFWIRARRRRIAVLVTAGISCLFIPFGTVIGVFTFIVLSRPSVIAQFEPRPQAMAPYEHPEEQPPSAPPAE